MKKYVFVAFMVILQFTVEGHTAMTDKQLYAVSMENDAQFIECVGNIFFAVANFQRIIVEDLKWASQNPEFQKINKSKESFKKASANLSAALTNSDKLLAELSGDKKKKFETQLDGFKSQVRDLNSRLEKIIAGVDQHQLPKIAGRRHRSTSPSVAILLPATTAIF